MSDHPETNFDLEQRITAIVKEYGAKPSALIMILQDIQKHFRYLPKDAMEMVAKKMRLPLAQIYGVATFYRSFSLEPKGKNHICVCTGTACHVRQANVIVDKLERDLGIKSGQTSADQQYSLESVNCLGACALGPLVTANDVYWGNMTVSKVDKMLAEVRGKKTPRTEEVA
ncbi:MAG: NAD(P)H-dependent oxidoreductase subunit E [bacterium]|nr:NAD(P)H-dependent oxidoreductase subunit E [bacterium]